MLGFSPISVFPISSIEEEGVHSLFYVTASAYSNPSYVVYFSTEDFITGSNDTPADTVIDGTLVKSLDYQRSIYGGSFGIGRFQSGFGTMEVIAADGGYDDLFDRYRPDGGRVALYIKDAEDTFARAFLAFDGVGIRWAIGRETGTIDVRDKSYLLDVPARRSTYAGTATGSPAVNALEGGSELAGKQRPIALGYVKNIPGVLVVPAENLYDLHDGRIHAVTACRDRGANLTFSADYATTDLLRAASIPSSQYATCLADGRARVGGNPSTQIRFDVSGDKTGGVFAYTTADLVERLIDAATELDADADLAAETFDEVNAQQPAPVGYYIGPDSNDTVRQCVEALMDGIGGWAGCTARGKFGLGIFEAPDAGDVPPFIYKEDEGDIISIDRQPLPEGLSPPPTSWRIAYDRNWARQDDIAGTVVSSDASLAAWLGVDARYATPSSPTVLQTGQKEKELTVESFFRDQADAEAEADRRLALYRQNFNLYVYEVKDHVFLHEIGRAPVVYHSRFGLSEGRPLRNVSINDDTQNNTVRIVGFG